MNADPKRQALDNSGNLFDKFGPTSLGAIPVGPLIRRVGPTFYINSPVIPSGGPAFSIGAITRVNPIPDDILERGNEEYQKAQSENNRKRKEMESGENAMSAMKSVKLSQVSDFKAGRAVVQTAGVQGWGQHLENPVK